MLGNSGQLCLFELEYMIFGEVYKCGCVESELGYDFLFFNVDFDELGQEAIEINWDVELAIELVE